MNAPDWLTPLAIAALALCGLCALVIILNLLAGHAQHMWIMNLVWPLTALYAGPVALLAYYRVGRPMSQRALQRTKAKGHGLEPAHAHAGMHRPFWQTAAVAATHCGSGCVLGDVPAEGLLILFPLALFGHKIFAAWVLDFILAFLFGIVFQYFTIKPMRHLSVRKGIAAALKADSLSLTAWQIGMYGWMAIATFLIFRRELAKTGPLFWFMMQIAMWLGFLTSYPVNWWLLKKGIKEKM